MKNKKKFSLFTLLSFTYILFSCTSTTTTTNAHTGEAKGDGNASTLTVIEEPDNEGEFTLTTEDGSFTQDGNIYTITKAGTYLATGKLEQGQILVQASEDEEVELQLSNATITNNSDSPIKAESADKVKVKAVKDTSNLIQDNRSKKTVDDDTVGEAAIYASCDLTLNGQGTLIVQGNYNNGVQSSDDLTLKNQYLQVEAYNNALKGNDSVTIEEGGNFKLISTAGDGIKTENSDISSKGNQKGNVTISAGTMDITANNDGIDAAYNIYVYQEGDIQPNIYIASGNYTAPTSKSGQGGWDHSTSSSESYKGMKADNEITIQAGVIDILSQEDALHANYGNTLENNEKGLGNVTIEGGTINIQAGDDGIHADNTIALKGGTLNIDMAYEGLEANFMEISGGYNTIYAVDDGVNASKKINQTPKITVTGGRLDVTVSSGDTDGIDSNGSYVQTGGVVIARAPGNSGNMNMGAIDADSGVSIQGGTLLIVGAYGNITASSSVLTKTWGSSSMQGGGGGRPFATNNSSISLPKGDISVNLDITVDFYLASTASQFAIYTSNAQKNVTYSVTSGSTTITNFTF